MELVSPEETPDFKPWGMSVKDFTMLMHLAQFAGVLFVPFAGLILPIVMWATNKDQSELVDRHGKNILNWMISTIVYSVICFVLFFVIIGVFALIALILAEIIFIIIAAVKASQGEVYEYPMAIKFIK